MKKTSFFLMAVLLIGSSCDSMLDLTPNEQIDENSALSTEQNVLAVLTGAYDGLSDADVLGGELYLAAELLGSDENELQFNGTFEEFRQYSRRTMDSGNPQVAAHWIDGYSTINRVNNVIAAIDRVSPSKRKQALGEAHFVRGVALFELVRHFAQPYSAGNTTTNLGVPIVTTPTRGFDGTPPARATVQAVYDQILDDLLIARDSLGAANIEGFATKAAAKAYLSRVYLEMGGLQANGGTATYKGATINANQLAANEANDLVTSGDFELLTAVADIYLQNSMTDEDIFAIPVSAVDGVNAQSTYYSSGIRADVDVLDAFLDRFENGDTRLGLISGGFTTKWDLNAQNISGNVLIVRYAEVLLNLAEAQLKLGNTAAAQTLYNQVRARAGAPAWAANAPLRDVNSNGTFDLADLLAERRRELCFEGHLIHDLRRNRQQVPVPNVGNVAYDSPLLVMPIPLREMEVNANLVQNQGY